MIAILQLRLVALLTGNKLDKIVLISHALELPTPALFTQENATFSVVKMTRIINLTIYGNSIWILRFSVRLNLVQIHINQWLDLVIQLISITKKCTFLVVFSKLQKNYQNFCAMISKLNLSNASLENLEIKVLKVQSKEMMVTHHQESKKLKP